MNNDLDNPIPIVTKQQMIDYIFAQPDDRMVDFDENYAGQKCGCIMVHYGKDNGIVGFDICGFQRWEGKSKGEDTEVLAKLEGDVTFGWFKPEGKIQCTYGEIKEFLRQKNWLPTKETSDESNS